MAFRFIHSADWQIGKVFRFVDGAEMSGLQLARLEAITRIGNLAGRHDVSHVLVTGDLYDHATPSPRTRNQVVERMRACTSVQWHLLPGNHDPYQPNGLWDQLRRRGLPANHRHRARRRRLGIARARGPGTVGACRVLVEQWLWRAPALARCRDVMCHSGGDYDIPYATMVTGLADLERDQLMNRWGF